MFKKESTRSSSNKWTEIIYIVFNILAQRGSLVPLMLHDPSDLGLICLVKKRKICF